MTKNICWEIDFWLEGPRYITISELTEWDKIMMLLKSIFTIPDELFKQILLQKISLKIILIIWKLYSLKINSSCLKTVLILYQKNAIKFKICSYTFIKKRSKHF